MIFGATWACPSCALRFSRRDACPSCGGPVVSLSDRDARALVQRGGGSDLLYTLGRWVPARPGITIAIGVLLALPALHSLFFAPAPPPQLLVLGGAGFGVALFSALALVGQRAQGEPKKLRVHAGAEPGAEVEEVTGIAKLATTQVHSLLGAEPCLAFGLRGQADGIEVDDADGGDFDLVLEGGAVLMVSLEHAKLEPSGDEKTIPLTPAEAAHLEAFLVERVGRLPRDSCTLRETILAAGDTVTVIGAFQGLAVSAAPFRAAARGRVLGGSPAHPLIVRVMKR